MIEQYKARAASIVFPHRKEDAACTDEELEQYFCECQASVEELRRLDDELAWRIGQAESAGDVAERESLELVRESVGRKLNTGRAHLASMIANRVARAR